MFQPKTKFFAASVLGILLLLVGSLVSFTIYLVAKSNANYDPTSIGYVLAGSYDESYKVSQQLLKDKLAQHALVVPTLLRHQKADPGQTTPPSRPTHLLLVQTTADLVPSVKAAIKNAFKNSHSPPVAFSLLMEKSPYLTFTPPTKDSSVSGNAAGSAADSLSTNLNEDRSPRTGAAETERHGVEDHDDADDADDHDDHDDHDDADHHDDHDDADDADDHDDADDYDDHDDLDNAEDAEDPDDNLDDEDNADNANDANAGGDAHEAAGHELDGTSGEVTSAGTLRTTVIQLRGDAATPIVSAVKGTPFLIKVVGQRIPGHFWAPGPRTSYFLRADVYDGVEGHDSGELASNRPFYLKVTPRAIGIQILELIYAAPGQEQPTVVKTITVNVTANE